MAVNLFSDEFYIDYRQPNHYIPKNKLFEELVKDICVYVQECIQNNIVTGNEIRIGYKLFSRMELSSKKMNELLNLYLQSENPNLYVKSEWAIEETVQTQVPVNNEITTLDIHKIHIKMIVYENNKDLAIKRFAKGCLHSLKSENRKYREYIG